MENNVNVNLGQQINTNINENAGKKLKTVDTFDISDSAFACVMFIALTLAFSVILSLSGITFTSTSFIYYVLNALVEAVFALASVLVALRRQVDIVKGTGMNKKINWNLVGWCFLLALISMLGFGNLTNVFIEILEMFGYSTGGNSIVINSFWSYLGWIIASCVFAAFCEEILFRGVIESGFRKWGIKVAVGCSALIFMIMHGSATQTIHQFIVGVIVGYIFYKTNNLWLGVLVHFFNNFIPITEVYLLSLVQTSETTTEVAETLNIGWGTILIDFVIAVVLALAGLYFVKAIIKRILKENEKVNGENKETSNENLTSIMVDGNEEHVEITIDGSATGENSKNKEKPEISKATIIMFALSGIYLVFEWILGTLKGFGLF